MENYVGKICPFCKTRITETDAVKVCPACGIPHHESCWIANDGCATFGCSGQAPVPQTAPVTPVQQTGNAVTCVCGMPLSENQLFCPKCGTPRPAAPRKNVCSKCGAEMQEGQMFCAKCGQKAGLVVDANVNTAISQFNAGVQKKNTKKKALVPAILGGVAVLVLLLVLLLKGPSVDEIILAKNSLEMRTGDSTTVSYTISPDKASDVEVQWKSSNTSVATVSSSGKITAKGEGSCTITVTAGGKSDKMTITVKSGPDLKALYNKFCNSTWAEVGSDGTYLSIDTNPYDWDDDGLAYPEAYYAVENIVNELKLPSSLLKSMGETSAADGRQTQEYDGLIVTWRYHPDNGLEVTFKLS